MTLGRLAVVFVVGVALALPRLEPATAAPPSARSVQAEIDRLGGEIATLDEDYNEARINLAKVKSQVRDLSRRSADAQGRLKALREVASRRAASVYQAGLPDYVMAFMSSSDASEASRKLALVAKVDQWESGLASDLTIASQRAENANADLQRTLARARSVERTIARKKDGLESRLGDQRQLLREVQAIQAAKPRRPAPAPAAPPPVVAMPASWPSVATAGARAAVAAAYRLLGRPYNYGSDGPSDFDCSGLTRFAWREGGVNLPHSSRAQFAFLPRVPREDLQPGDLVFFGNPIHHVGVYVGGGQMIHAPETGSTVEVASAYRRDFAGAARPG